MSGTPRLLVEPGRVTATGDWTLAALVPVLPALRKALVDACDAERVWDVSSVERLDSAAAVLLWRAWGDRWPPDLLAGDLQRRTIERVAATRIPTSAREVDGHGVIGRIGVPVLRLLDNAIGMIAVYGQFLLDAAYFVRHPREMPWRELSANIYKAGALALPVAALVGFLIGITISYLSALQLRSVGADLFIINILGISIVRELGPVLVAVLVAGRSGSALTAQIGVMRVTEEIDALAAMGVSRSRRVIFPKILALTVAMPLLVLWASAMALIGGMLSANLQLDISLVYFIENLQRAVPVSNLVIGIGKGVVFGFMVGWIACHFGLRVAPNTESLSAHTTRSVVTSITLVILMDAVFAILTRNIGVPQL